MNIVCRDRESGEAYRKEILDQHKQANPESLILHIFDVTDMVALKAFTTAFLEAPGELDVLIHVADEFAIKKAETEDKMDRIFVKNVLSVYCLTIELLPCLEKREHSRCIVLSNGNMYLKALNATDPECKNAKLPYKGVRVYSTTKVRRGETTI